jgi:hypothetical protein
MHQSPTSSVGWEVHQESIAVTDIAQDQHAAVVARRGVHCPVAGTTVAARGARPRCAHPRQLRHDRDCTPAAYAPGERRPPGGLTQPGHTPTRRARRTGAWASRSPAQLRRLRRRHLEQVSMPLQDLSWQGPLRGCQRERQRRARGQHANQGVVTLARAWRAVMWAMAQEVPRTPEPETLASSASVLPRGRPAIGSDAAPVWCSPRRRDEAARPPRSEIEAGSRRTQVRWEPTHAYPQDQPSSLPGAGSAAGRHAPGYSR